MYDIDGVEATRVYYILRLGVVVDHVKYQIIL